MIKRVNECKHVLSIGIYYFEAFDVSSPLSSLLKDDHLLRACSIRFKEFDRMFVIPFKWRIIEINSNV